MKLNLSRTRFARGLFYSVRSLSLPLSLSLSLSLAVSPLLSERRLALQSKRARTINKLLEKLTRQNRRTMTYWRHMYVAPAYLRSIERARLLYRLPRSVCHVLSNFIYVKQRKKLLSIEQQPGDSETERQRRTEQRGTGRQSKSRRGRLSGFANDVRLAEFFLAYGITRIGRQELGSRSNVCLKARSSLVSTLFFFSHMSR